MRAFIFFCVSFFCLQLSAQITGTITNSKGELLPFVNIYIENTFTGTTSNDQGKYELDISKKNQEQTIIFQYLGYKTIQKTIKPKSYPFQLNMVMTEESLSLEEVIISATEDPAYPIIRKTIAHRKENLNRIAAYTAKFYSRGLWKVKDLPEKIMGQEIGDLDGSLDSTRTGIIYLSETISDIAFQKPDNFKEVVNSSLVSGNDNGFSFNSARQSNFSFYENTIDFNTPIVSPIANGALSYYKYKLDGAFYEGSKLINKIIVSPKRPKDRVWEGIIYIVEDDWQLYGVDLTTNGNAIQVPMITEMNFKQNFTFDKNTNAWIKISQTINFGFSFFGVKGDGSFIAIYSDYDFNPAFNKKTFTNEIQSFTQNANKKDSIYWKKIRPVPLTTEEVKDYVKKDSIHTLRQSKTYLDSLDKKSNKIGFLSPITGYSYKNSYKKWNLNYEGPLLHTSYNTIQGWASNLGLTFTKWYDENQITFLTAMVNANYGFSEDRLRLQAFISKRFNYINKRTISLSGGSKITQFNEKQPIKPLINSISTLFFERNYMKVYELNFVKVNYSQEITNGIDVILNTGFENRKPLFNTADWVFIPNKGVRYTSNNPTNLLNFTNAAIEEHQIIKTNLQASFVFGQKYFSFPDAKFNLTDSKYPKLNLDIENGIGTSKSSYNYTQLSAGVSQYLSLGNKGQLTYKFKGGTFIHGDHIAFVDYQHFNGNQTRVGTTQDYTNIFNLLPYYQLSTNKSYFEGHLEHDFKGWILGKIPLINKLNYNLVAGANILATENQKPYGEISLGIDNLGFGKYRLLRLDYVQSLHQGERFGAFIFGLKFLELFN
ncbi:MAG: DUF5686 and carboxypeptidase regulatory-like domain-containing protein [Flavobacteriales bacterium]